MQKGMQKGTNKGMQKGYERDAKVAKGMPELQKGCPWDATGCNRMSQGKQTVVPRVKSPNAAYRKSFRCRKTFKDGRDALLNVTRGSISRHGPEGMDKGRCPPDGLRDASSRALDEDVVGNTQQGGLARSGLAMVRASRTLPRAASRLAMPVEEYRA